MHSQKASHWPEGLISKSGKYAKDKILAGKVETETEATTSESADSSETSESSETT